jgi:superfamily II DNA/RNA helicase
MPFLALGLTPNIVRAAVLQGFETPSAIQTLVIPVILSGSDLLACAQTGSGKTLAYGLPLLQRLATQPTVSPRQPTVLVLVPTRELAIQVGESLRNIANHMDVSVRISVVFGGVALNPQLMAMRGGTNLIIATPGRLLDLVSHNAVSLSTVKHYVLDEADRLLDMGFQEELRAIEKLLPQDKQNLFFSATYPERVLELAQTMLHEPARISIPSEPQSAPDITQHAILVDTGRRTQLLRHLISTQHWKRVLVFVATKHAAEIVADKLRKARIYAEPFHGELSQGKRMQVLSDFKASRLKVVIATDMASRGLDIRHLPVVVNYDLPRSSIDYTHRIGRTGRAGEAGIAYSFVTPQTRSHFRMIEKKNVLSIAVETVEGFEPAMDDSVAEEASKATGGVKGKRPSKKDKLRAAAKLQ